MFHSTADEYMIRRNQHTPLEISYLFNYRLKYPELWQEPTTIRIGVTKYSDLFHKDVSTGLIYQVLTLMLDSPQHTFEILTKSPYRLRTILQSWVHHVQMPLNMHIGVSARNQSQADRQLPILLTVPASIFFESCEVLQGPIDLNEWLYRKRKAWTVCPLDKVFIDADRPNQKPRYREWLNRLHCQCQDAGETCAPQRWNTRSRFIEWCKQNA